MAEILSFLRNFHIVSNRPLALQRKVAGACINTLAQKRARCPTTPPMSCIDTTSRCIDIICGAVNLFLIIISKLTLQFYSTGVRILVREYPKKMNRLWLMQVPLALIVITGLCKNRSDLWAHGVQSTLLIMYCLGHRFSINWIITKCSLLHDEDADDYYWWF